jgi:NADH-quinone oxidoreductase subunit L
MRRMGGLWNKIPKTFFTILCAAVAISGVPPFSGFFSKDAILLAAYEHAPWMYWVGVSTAGMTAFYVFRAVFLTFFGAYRGDGHPHESPAIMTIPLLALAALSLGGGFINVPKWLEPMFPAAEHENFTLMAISVAAGLIGILLAYVFYVRRPGLTDAFRGPLYRLVYNKYFVDEIYDAAVVQPTVAVSRGVLWRGLDVAVIDGMVNGVATASRSIGTAFKYLQSGNIRSYATWIVFGSILLIITVGMIGGIR